MNFALTDEEIMLVSSAELLNEEHFSAEKVRILRNLPLRRGEPCSAWSKMAELGFLGIGIAPEYGGIEMGMPALALVQEQFGRSLALTPYFSTVLFAGQLISKSGSQQQKSIWLPRIVSGDAIISVAYQERGGRFDLASVSTEAMFSQGDYLISGEKMLVLDGHQAEAFIVTARDSSSKALLLFIVKADTLGVSVEASRLIDSRPSATVRFDRVRVAADQILGPIESADRAFQRAANLATIGLCAEMVGGMQRAFDLTIDYLREREQFGVKIGTFQALQHRAARMFISLSLARPAVRAAALAAQQDNRHFRALVSQAKAICSEAYMHIANEAIQMHGGIGMTDEYPVGHYLKAARVGEMMLGDAQWHRAQWATLHGY